MISVVCATCERPFTAHAADRRKYCGRKCAVQGRRESTPVHILRCGVCSKEFRVPPYRKKTALYCSLACAGIGNAPLYRGERNFNYGKPASEYNRQQSRLANAGKTPNAAQLDGLKLGQAYFRGKKASDDPILAARNAKMAEGRRGKPNPGHSEWAKRYYAEHPEKHPNHICAQKGRETGIERKMREALAAASLCFERQYRLGRYWVDFAIPSRRLAIEVDGVRWHDATKDARRDAEIAAMGWTVLRFSEAAVNSGVGECVAAVIRFLSTRGLSPEPIEGFAHEAG